MARTTQPRCNTTTCVKCRRKFERGDRVQVVNIIDKIGGNPNNVREEGAWLTGEFELQHANCQDPTLDSTITVRAT